jgi:hypothetical protein
MTGLDNNPAERALRRPVVTRKNAYGPRNEDAARLAARIWTATAQMAGLNVLTYLTAYRPVLVDVMLDAQEHSLTGVGRDELLAAGTYCGGHGRADGGAYY